MVDTVVSPSRRQRRVASWLAAALVPAGICAGIILCLDDVLNVAGDSALFFVGVLLVALLGGIFPAAGSAVLSGLLLNYFLTEPRHTLRIADPDTAVTVVVMLVMAVAVAALVDNAATRQRQARHAAREAELLTSFADSILSGANLDTLLGRVRDTYSQRAVSMVRIQDAAETMVAGVGEDPCRTVRSADTGIAAGDGQFWLLLAGPGVHAGDQRVLTVVAGQAAGLVRQRELTEEAGKAQAIEKADELRRSLLTAVGHDLRTPLAGAKAAVSSLRADDVGFSEQDTAELLATVEESVDQLTALVDNLLDSSRLAAGAVRPELRRTYLDDAIQAALLSISRGATGFGPPGVDRVAVEVGDATVMSDPGLLERVLANIIDNALRHGRDGRVRISAERIADGVRIAVIDRGPGVPRGAEAQLFEPFQRLGDRDNKSGVGLGLAVARGFVEAMGGTITAAETPGGGLTVGIELAAPAESGG